MKTTLIKVITGPTVHDRAGFRITVDLPFVPRQDIVVSDGVWCETIHENPIYFIHLNKFDVFVKPSKYNKFEDYKTAIKEFTVNGWERMDKRNDL